MYEPKEEFLDFQAISVQILYISKCINNDNLNIGRNFYCSYIFVSTYKSIFSYIVVPSYIFIHFYISYSVSVKMMNFM